MLPFDRCKPGSDSKSSVPFDIMCYCESELMSIRPECEVVNAFLVHSGTTRKRFLDNTNNSWFDWPVRKLPLALNRLISPAQEHLDRARDCRSEFVVRFHHEGSKVLNTLIRLVQIAFNLLRAKENRCFHILLNLEEHGKRRESARGTVRKHFGRTSRCTLMRGLTRR